jgi:ribosomal protein S18 acetylase RimI-like enzyme
MIKIRNLRKSDEKQLLRLAINFFKKEQRGKIVSKRLFPLIEYKDYDNHLREDVKDYMNLDPKEAIIFVAEDNGKLIGFIHGKIDQRPKKVLNRVGIIDDWFVEKDYRGKEIGEKLWDKLMKWFKSKRCNCLELDVFTTNKKAIKIYHKLGFIDKVLFMMRKL